MMDVKKVFEKILGKDCAASVLVNEEELAEWIKRLLWHVRKCNELAEENEDLKGELNDCMERFADLEEQILELHEARDEERNGPWNVLNEYPPEAGRPLIVTIWDSIRCRKELRYPVIYRKSLYCDQFDFYVAGIEEEVLLPEYSKILAWRYLPDVWGGAIE